VTLNYKKVLALLSVIAGTLLLLPTPSANGSQQDASPRLRGSEERMGSVSSGHVEVHDELPPAPVITTDGGNGPGVGFVTREPHLVLEGTCDSTIERIIVNGVWGDIREPGDTDWTCRADLGPGLHNFNFVAMRDESMSEPTRIKVVFVPKFPPPVTGKVLPIGPLTSDEAQLVYAELGRLWGSLRVYKSVAITSLICVVLLTFRSALLAVVSRRAKRAASKARERIFALLDGQLESASHLTLQYIRHVVAAVERELSVDVPVKGLLQDYVVHLGSTEIEGDQNLLEAKRTNILSLIDEHGKERPFESLPKEEERLFRALKESMNSGNKENVDFNLNELCSVVTVRNNEHRKLQRWNRVGRWSLLFTILGMLVAIFFGVHGILSARSAKQTEAAREAAQEATEKAVVEKWLRELRDGSGDTILFRD